jgi:hypothetical protein
MRILILVALLAMFTGPVAAETNWHRVAANSLLFVDMLQTVEISKNNKFIEANKVLGKHPTEREVYQYFALATVLVNVIGETLPEKYSDVFYISASVVQIATVCHNIRAGVKIRF